MSSKYVRDQVKAKMAGLTEPVLDLSGQFDKLKDFLADNGVNPGRDPWYGLQFVPSEDVPITVGSDNTQGKYREIGIVFIHVVEMAANVSSDNIVDRGETIRDLFRGERLGTMIIEGVTPINFESAATLQFEGGYTSGSIVLNYYRDFDF